MDWKPAVSAPTLSLQSTDELTSGEEETASVGGSALLDDAVDNVGNSRAGSDTDELGLAGAVEPGEYRRRGVRYTECGGEAEAECSVRP